MFCPDCHSEYREGFTRCAECDVYLVTEHELRARHAEPEPDNSPAVTIFESGDFGTVQLVKSLLEEEGIGCSVRNERMLGLFPVLSASPALGDRGRLAEVQVTANNAERARRILARLPNGADVETP